MYISLQLWDGLNSTTYSTFSFIKTRLKNQIKFYVSIYATQGGVVNGVQMNFYKDSLYWKNRDLIYVFMQYNFHLYQKSIFKKIEIGSNSSHLIAITPSK